VDDVVRALPGGRPGGRGATARTGAATGAGLLDAARQALLLAPARRDPVARYRQAHRAAVTGAVAAAGVLARPTSTRAPQRAVWSLLAEHAPELTEWAWFLASAAPARSGPGPGALRVGERDADDLVRQVAQFLDLLERVVARRCRRTA
jgi:hypothetical protein